MGAGSVFKTAGEIERARLLAAGFTAANPKVSEALREGPGARGIHSFDSAAGNSAAGNSSGGFSSAERRASQGLFLYAGCKAVDVQRLYLRVGVVAALGVALALFFLSLIPLVLPLIWVAGEYLRLNQRTNRRCESFESEFTALLVSLASSVRAGVDPIQALATGHEVFVSPGEIRTELLRFKELIAGGERAEGALAAFAASIRHPDIELFRSAVYLNLKEGASLAGALDRLTKVIRQRQSFRRKARSAVAMQRLSALGITLAFVAILGVQAVTNSETMLKVLDHPIGLPVLVTGMVLLFTGVFWMLRLCRNRV